jgi:hypothetical protein
MENYQKIGKLNLNKLGKYKKLLATDEVILTEERIHHIKEKHQEQYDELKEYIEWVVYDPDYILQDMQHNETIILLKEILKDEKRIKMIIRLSVNKFENKSNSIITFWKIRKRDYNKTIQKSKIIFQKNLDINE